MTMGSSANSRTGQPLSTSGRAWGEPARPAAGPAWGERGVTMIFVLMAILLVGAVTISVMQVISGDVGGGIEAVEADQVFNIAQAGAHYVIGKLQLAGTAQNYAGETVQVKNGSTTLGTAVVTVSCIDTGAAPTSTGCATDAAYRRVISVGSLPVSGPSRTVVAVVKGTPAAGGGGTAATFCALSKALAGTIDTSPGDVTSIYADIASLGSIDLTPGPTAGLIKVLGDPGTPQKYTGKLAAAGSVKCGTGCSAAGGLYQNQLPSSLGCTAPTLPTFSPGATNVTVAAGTTYPISSAGGAFNNITLNQGTCSGASPFTTLQIGTSTTDPTAVTVVQLNSLNMLRCPRLMVTGMGKVDLRIAQATGQGVNVRGYNAGTQPDHFGVDAADTLATTSPISADRLVVSVNSDGLGGTGPGGVGSATCFDPNHCAAMLSHMSGGATFIVPNGRADVDDSAEPNVFNGGVVAKELEFGGNGFWKSDTRGATWGGTPTYSNFNTLMSWKDQ